MADPSLAPVVVFSPRALVQGAVVEGCSDPQAVNDFVSATVFEKRVKGFALGLLVGAVAYTVLAIYAKSEGY